MFCPKCGNKIPDGAAFCPKCGAKFAAKTAPAAAPAAKTVKPSKPAPAARTADPSAKSANPSAAKSHTAPSGGGAGMSFDAGAIVPLVVGVIAIILAFMPWFSPSASDLQASQYISDGANNISSFFGGDSTVGEAYRLKSTYTMLEIGDYGKALTAYGQSDGEVFGMLTYVWAVPVILSVIGLIMTVVQKKVAVARIGFTLLAIAAAFAAIVSMRVSGPIYPALCCIASIATVVTAGGAKKES